MTGLKELTARSLYTLGLSYALGNRWEEAVAYAEEARTLYAVIEDQAGEASGLSAQLIYAGSPPSWQLTKRAMEVLCLCLLALCKRYHKSGSCAVCVVPGSSSA
jgi:hypothetical protein